MGVNAAEAGHHSGTDEHRSDGPIYIGGLDRSGKTTMRAFLASHPRIAIPEVGSNMWTYFYRRYGDLDSDKNLDACLEAMAGYKHVHFLQPDIAAIRSEFQRGDRTYARLFSLFLRQYAERQGKPRWGAQTGLIERYGPELFDAVPGVKVIHMIRDPRDRYEASLALWPEGKGRAGGAVARWRYSEGLARRHEQRWPNRYKVVRFEDMISSPEATLEDVCSFLGEDFHREMLDMWGAEKHRKRMTSESARNEVLSGEFIGRYRSHVSRDEVAFIQLQLGSAMKRRGYHLDPSHFSLGEWASFFVRVFPDQTARMVAWRSLEAVQEAFPKAAGRRPGKRMLVRDPT